jgi:RHS repeat-associated protein
MLTYEKNLTTGVIREYAYLNNQIIGWKETDSTGNSVKRYAVTDLLGSVTTVTDESGTVLWSGEYTAFGNVAYGSGDVLYDGMYTGKDIDSETGLTYHWNRWRNEDGSSFISEDPARDGSNWYGYCGNNPINSTDPTGLSTTRDDYAYQLRMQGRTGEANDMEKEAADDNNGRTEPVEPKQGPTEPQKVEVPLPKFLLNFITSFGITKDPDSAFYRFCAERIRENIHIVITRSPLDNGHNGQYFKSTIAIMFGDTTIFSAPVQSTMDENNPDRLGSNDFTLPAGLYEGRFMDDLYSQTYLHPILIFSTDFYIHPDTITNQDMVQARIDEDNPNPTGPFFTPHSKGCQIMKTSDFNTMINFFNTVGFGYGDKINVEIKNPDNWAYK